MYVLDEAQYVPQIGMGLKIIVDQIKDIKVVATGSSSFTLVNKLSEPLTGRKNVLKLFPLSQLELRDYYVNKYELMNALPEFLIYGAYPEIIELKSLLEKQQRIEEISKSYLLADILNLGVVKNEQVLWRLLQHLAYQVSSLVSLNELASKLGVSVKTIQRYLDLLEKSFVIVSVGGWSRNLRDEIVSKKKYYFVDLGVRNSIISNFNPLEVRNDIGQLWENFVFIERLKKRTYQGISANYFYWQNWKGKEIDLVEEREGKLFAYEMKWKNNSRVKIPKQFLEAYPDCEFSVIHKDNYLDFVGK